MPFVERIVTAISSMVVAQQAPQGTQTTCSAHRSNKSAPENVFTGPQNNINNVDMVTLNTDYHFTPTLSLSNVVYFRNFRQTVANGDNSDYAACPDDVAPGLLCDGDYGYTAGIA